MLKRFFILLLSVCSAAILQAAPERLFIGNAANGAPVNILQHEAMKLAFSGKYEVSMKHLKPSAAMAALRNKEVDILLLDTRFLPENTAGLKIYPYAAEALCIYIHPGNPLGSLTKAEIVRILTLSKPRWKDFNGAPEDIQRIMLKSGSSGATLVNRVFGNIDLAAGIFRVSNLQQVFAFLNPAAIGFAPFQAERSAEMIAVPVDDILPTTATVRSGKYPLTVHYAFVCTADAPEPVEKLLTALSAPAALNALQNLGIIPIWKE